MRLTDSETTGFQKAGSALANVTGTGPSETELMTSQAGSLLNENVANRLSDKLPAETDKAVAQWLLTSHNVMLSARMTLNEPEVSIAPVVDKTPNYAAAAEAVTMSLTPAPSSALEAWLAELEAVTASRKGDTIDAGLKLVAYVRRLSEYPADVVRHVLLEKSRKWWPTWDELRTDLERLTAPRRLAVSRLRKAHNEESQPIPKQFTPPSDDAKAQAQAEIDTWRAEIETREAQEQPEGAKHLAWQQERDRRSGREVLEHGKPSAALLATLSSNAKARLDANAKPSAQE